jgi:hypothetical protein
MKQCTRPRSARAPFSLLALLVAAGLSLGIHDCEHPVFGGLLPLGQLKLFGSTGSPLFYFRAPLPRQLSLTGEIGFELALPPHADAASLQVRLVGASGAMPLGGVTVEAGRGRGSASGSVVIDEAGIYHLEAEVEARGRRSHSRHLEAATSFEIVALQDADQCEILNDAECLLPYPSSRFLVHADTQTGYRVDIPQVGIPRVKGTQIPASMVNQVDGFSPTVQILMHFPGGVDLEQSEVARLLMQGSSGPPYILTRAHDARSLEADSPTLLIDWDTGERILHWVEMDARAVGNPERQALILRPAVSLTPGHRYIVAVRNLVHADGTPVEAEPTFAALRDLRPTDIPALAARRVPMWQIFRKLRRAGVKHTELILAFDFVVQSDHQLTHQMLSMRDQALA